MFSNNLIFSFTPLSFMNLVKNEIDIFEERDS